MKTNPHADRLIADVNSDMTNPYAVPTVRKRYSPAGEAFREFIRSAFPPPADGSKRHMSADDCRELLRLLQAENRRLDASRNRRQAS